MPDPGVASERDAPDLGAASERGAPDLGAASERDALDSGPIVCATRGGQGSRAAQRRAVEEAKATGRSLVYLYIADTGEILEEDPGLRDALVGELSWLGACWGPCRWELQSQGRAPGSRASTQSPGRDVCATSYRHP